MKLFLYIGFIFLSSAFSPTLVPTQRYPCSTRLHFSNVWDDDVNYEKEFPDSEKSSSSDPNLNWSAPLQSFDNDGTLGIDLGSMLPELTEEEAEELRMAATEIINEGFASGIDDMEKLRAKMKRELEKKRNSMRLESEWNAQKESEKLMSKIDELTDAFLSQTEGTRRTTKLAAAADRAMEGKGLEMGIWGTFRGAAVTTGEPSYLLGSISAAQKVSEGQKQENRMLVIADDSQDSYAKQLLGPLAEKLKETLPGLEIKVYKPTATIPLGGDNAAAVLLFLTSFSDVSSVKNVMDRVLRKIISSGGKVGTPPTHVIAVSTIGTSRTNKMPYSMQNLMGGGKLQKIQQMEEAVISIVRNRAVEPALDFTICKLGELKDTSEPFILRPGDCVDGSVTLNTAVAVVEQAIAYQPDARNSTLCVVGKLDPVDQDVLDDDFLRLDGPELFRIDLSCKADKNYASLTEYIREWAGLLAESGKGLTTPIRMEIPMGPRPRSISGIRRQARTQLLFLPTNTGKNYLSKTEERRREQQSSNAALSQRNLRAKEGGLEIILEETQEHRMRVRVKRCNYANEAAIKEMTEETIISRLKESLQIWAKSHAI